MKRRSPDFCASRDKLKREQQEKDTILNELQTNISIFERTGDVMTYQKGYQIEIKNYRVTPTGLNGARYYDQEFNSESSDIEVLSGPRTGKSGCYHGVLICMDK